MSNECNLKYIEGMLYLEKKTKKSKKNKNNRNISENFNDFKLSSLIIKLCSSFYRINNKEASYIKSNEFIQIICIHNCNFNKNLLYIIY